MFKVLKNISTGGLFQPKQLKKLSSFPPHASAVSSNSHWREFEGSSCKIRTARPPGELRNSKVGGSGVASTQNGRRDHGNT